MQKYQSQFELIFVFILAGVVRLTDLGVFRAVDEEDRWAWAIDFYKALLAGDLPATLIGDGYPGVFPAWLETAWLFAGTVYGSVMQGSWLGQAGIYGQLHDWGRWSNLPLQRFPIALANTILVVIIFWYVRRLFNHRVALVAAIFISLDPFLLSDSRVNRAEALLAGLMTISLLALILWLKESAPDAGPRRAWRWLIVSAVVGGLAILTKLQALVLLPMFAVIVLAWVLVKQSDWRRMAQVWLGWLAAWSLMAVATFVLLWPAMWTVPVDTLALMTKFLTRKVGEEGVKIFFLGRTVLDEDPGWLYYPVIFILRVTPLNLFGLLLGVWFSALDFRLYWANLRHREAQIFVRIKTWIARHAEIWALAGYALLYVAGMSLGSHKHDRFLMAIFPVISILAALGWLALVAHWSLLSRRFGITLATLTAVALLTALPYHPYYFSYFNPLTGGGSTATQLTRIGWGEGMDQVADYLNTLENPSELQVAARFYKYLLGFEGEAINLDADGGWVHADKIIFYIQQSQRRLDPSPGVIDYFQQHIPTEQTITINGIDYAEIYPNPIHFPAAPIVDRVADTLALFGYRWAETDSGATATLVVENLADQAQIPAVRLYLTPQQHGEWSACSVRPGFEDAAQTPGGVVEYDCPLTVASLTPTLYTLQLGIPKPNGGYQPFDFAAGRAAIAVNQDGSLTRVAPETAFAQLADRALPADAVRLARAFDYEVLLLGYTLSPVAPQPGDPLNLTLYWQTTAPRELPAHITVQGFVGDNRVAMQNQPPTRDIRQWLPGEVLSDTIQLNLPADVAAPALLRLDVGLFNPDIMNPYQVRDLAGVDIPGEIARLAIQPTTPLRYNGPNPLDYRLGETVNLIGADITQPDAQTMDVTLYWGATGTLDDDYTAFVHLLGPDGTLAAQSDVPPQYGLYPTSAWQAGDVVPSVHRLTLPADMADNDYQLVAGLYRPGDWARLPVSDAAGKPQPNDAAVLP